MRSRWLTAVLLLALCGCAAKVIDPPGTAAPSRCSRSLSQEYWGNRGQVWQGRFGAALEGDGQVFTFHGVLVTDTRQGQVRMLALSDLGMRLFDVTWTGGESSVHAALPHPGLWRLRERIAIAVRRMLLSHLPGPRDEVASGEEILLRRCAGDACLVSAFDGDSGDLLYKEYAASQPLWRVTFSDYRGRGGCRVPSRLCYVDSEQEFTLTLEWNPDRKE